VRTKREKIGDLADLPTSSIALARSHPARTQRDEAIELSGSEKS
jgi:hypothetical protein